MEQAQKPDFVFRRKGRVYLNRQGASVQSTTGSRGVRISGTNAGYTVFRSSVKSTGYPFLSPVSPSLTLPRVTVCHHISTGVYPSSAAVHTPPPPLAFSYLIGLMLLQTTLAVPVVYKYLQIWHPCDFVRRSFR